METMLILGDGPLGRAVETAARGRASGAPGRGRPDDADLARDVRLLGRPAAGRHDPRELTRAELVVEASRGDAVVPNLTAALDAGCRRFVIATTGWTADRPRVESLLLGHGAAAVTASNFSVAVVLFGRLVDAAVGLFGALESFDPYLLEWHRRSKRDRPSGTATDLARRIAAAHPGLRTAEDLEVVSIRAGASPGMHLVGFDAAGETIELRLTARDRSAYAVGILTAADWLARVPREPGLHPFDPIVDELIARVPVAA
jgi:4-hydroxy-tetrahydrodipicolinate reductase